MRIVRFLGFFFGITILPYLVLCLFNEPSYDDFSYAVSTFGKTFWQTQVHWYIGWSGRFTATALLTSVNPLVYHWIYGYKFISLAIILGLLAVVHFLVKTCFGQLTAAEQRSLVLFFGALYLSLLPDLSGGVYWMSGALTCAVPTMLAGLGIALIIRRRGSLFKDYLLLPLLTFLIVGCNETIMLIWMALLFYINVYALYKHKKVDTVLALLLAVGIAGSLVVNLAPGNAVRGSGFPKAHRLLHSISESVAYVFAYTVKFGSVPFLLVLVWVAKYAKAIQERLGWNWVNKNSLMLTLSLLLLVQFCTFFPAEWAMGGRPPKYVYNMTVFFYVPLLIMIVIQTAIIYPKIVGFLNKVELDNRKMVLAFCLLFLTLGNNGRAIHDAAWEAPRYDDEITARYARMTSSPGEDVVFKRLLHKPRSLFYSDLDGDPTTFKNRQYARYFGLRSVKTF